MPDNSNSTPPGFTAPSQTEPLRMALKPKSPHKYSGQRDYNIIETWIATVSSYFILSNAQPPYLYYALNTLFDGDAEIWYRYHFVESASLEITWETVHDNLRAYFAPANKLKKLHDEST